MSCSIEITIQLGDQLAGKTLLAKLIDSTGATLAPITSRFTDLTGGNYLFHTDSIPCDFRGAICFSESSDPTTILAVTSVNSADLINASSGGISFNTGHATQTITVEKSDPRYTGTITIKLGSETVGGVRVQR
jgi:hypothetical protein